MTMQNDVTQKIEEIHCEWLIDKKINEKMSYNEFIKLRVKAWIGRAEKASNAKAESEKKADYTHGYADGAKDGYDNAIGKDEAEHIAKACRDMLMRFMTGMATGTVLYIEMKAEIAKLNKVIDND